MGRRKGKKVNMREGRMLTAVMFEVERGGEKEGRSTNRDKV